VRGEVALLPVDDVTLEALLRSAGGVGAAVGPSLGRAVRPLVREQVDEVRERVEALAARS
jgi:hypothetical protein